MRWRSPSPEATRECARRLGAAIAPEGLVLALEGPLGAGKTAFVQGVAAGLGIDPRRVTSPTFAIAAELAAPDGRRLAHVDLYRLESAAELDAAGFADLLGAGAVVAVEWADRFPEALPDDRLRLRLERPTAAAQERMLHAEATGRVSAAAFQRWRSSMNSLDSEQGRT